MTPQSSFMIVAAVRDGQLKDLRALLASMNNLPGHAEPNNDLIPFDKFDRVHFARFVFIEARTAHEIREFGVTPRPWRTTLAFLGDIDGDIQNFLLELIEQAAPGLKKIFSHCEGFSEEDQDLLGWMKANNINASANYVNWIGRTVRQINEEAALHRSLSIYLQKIADDVAGRMSVLYGKSYCLMSKWKN